MFWFLCKQLCVVLESACGFFSSLAAEKAFSYPVLSSGRIFTLSFSAGVSKNRLGIGFTEERAAFMKSRSTSFFIKK
jgi:hypothetical protein